MIFAAANASGATLLSLDDPTVDTDQGNAFTASFTTARFDLGPTGGWATLRRLVQAVILSNTATVKVTPIADGTEYPSQQSTSSLTATSGTEQIVETPTFAPGTRFQMKVEVTAHSGTVELGESDQWFVNRRTTRSR
jgi:chitodextrinase